jgi:hypothetical protein
MTRRHCARKNLPVLSGVCLSLATVSEFHYRIFFPGGSGSDFARIANARSIRFRLGVSEARC